MTFDRSITLTIEGMSCDHCVEHVTEALEQVDGVAEADVGLEAGKATVRLKESVSRRDLAAAVEEAGYQVPPGA